MQQRKSRIFIIYFLLLILLGSIHNIGVNKVKLANISKINILGLGIDNNDLIMERINNLELGNIFFIKKKKLQRIIDQNTLVEKYDIFKVYPSSLYINIQKTNFLARMNYNGVNFIIGSNGKFSNNELYQKELPYIFGSPKIDEFLHFKKIIEVSKLEYKDIKNFYYYASGRWDIEFINEIIVKLPIKDIDNAIQLVFEFLDRSDLQQIKIIDARIKNQIIIND